MESTNCAQWPTQVFVALVNSWKQTIGKILHTFAVRKYLFGPNEISKARARRLTKVKPVGASMRTSLGLNSALKPDESISVLYFRNRANRFEIGCSS